MEIVLARIEDAEELSYVKKEVWETTYRGIYDDNVIDGYDYAERKNKFIKLIKSDNQEVYVCKDNNRIVGYMVLGEPLHEKIDNYDLTINDLGIIYDYRKKGIGTRFINIAKSKKRKLFNCCNYYNDKAKMFYEKNGGKIVKTVIDENDKRYSQVYYVYE